LIRIRLTPTVTIFLVVISSDGKGMTPIATNGFSS